MFKKDDQDVWETRSGGGCLMLFGLPFLAAGLFTMAGALGVVPMQSNVSQYVVFLIGLLFSIVGGVVAFFRAGVTIDRRRNTITKWYGVWSLVKKTEYLIDYYNRVSVSEEVRSSSKSSYSVYPVRLHGGEGVEPLELGSPRVYREARKTAEELAGFLNRPLADSTSGVEVVRQPGELNESVRARAWRTKEKSKVPEPPAQMKSQVHMEVGSTIVELPSPGFSMINKISIFMSIAIAAFVAYMFLLPILRMGMPRMIKYLLIGLFGTLTMVPLLTALFRVLRQVSSRVRVSVSPEMLRVERLGFLRREIIEIPSGELEELTLFGGSSSPEPLPAIKKFPSLGRLGSSGAIVAMTDTQTIQFGEGLSEEELRYLHALIMKALTE